MRAVLSPFGFRDSARADAELQALADSPRARELLADVITPLLAELAEAADPDQALGLLERYARAAVNRVALLSYLAESPSTMTLLARSFGVSPFMAEILVRDPSLLYWVADATLEPTPRHPLGFVHELDTQLAPLRTLEARAEALRLFKRRQVLLIGVRDILRLATIPETLEALSALADALIAAACSAATTALREATGDAPPRLAVIALGKLGANELNFSSDVDLLYVCGSEDEVPASERLARGLTSLLSAVTHEGSVYRVDLRLRPEGRVGGLVTPLAAAARYYASRGATWERLALLRARAIAGDGPVGQRFVENVAPFVFDRAVEPETLTEIRALKTRIDEQAAERGDAGIHVKLGLGGIREIELLTQTLQIAHARQQPALRRRSTLFALTALAELGHLTPHEHEVLREAYLFLRDVENRLQMADDVQRHALPRDAEGLQRLARGLGCCASRPGRAPPPPPSTRSTAGTPLWSGSSSRASSPRRPARVSAARRRPSRARGDSGRTETRDVEGVRCRHVAPRVLEQHPRRCVPTRAPHAQPAGKEVELLGPLDRQQQVPGLPTHHAERVGHGPPEEVGGAQRCRARQGDELRFGQALERLQSRRGAQLRPRATVLELQVLHRVLDLDSAPGLYLTLKRPTGTSSRHCRSRRCRAFARSQGSSLRDECVAHGHHLGPERVGSPATCRSLTSACRSKAAARPPARSTRAPPREG